MIIIILIAVCAFVYGIMVGGAIVSSIHTYQEHEKRMKKRRKNHKKFMNTMHVPKEIRDVGGIRLLDEGEE